MGKKTPPGGGAPQHMGRRPPGPGGVILGHFGGVWGSGGGFLPKTLGLGILNLSGHPWPKLPPRSPLTPRKPPQKAPKPPQNGPEAKPRQNRDKNGRAAGRRSSRSTLPAPGLPREPTPRPGPHPRARTHTHTHTSLRRISRLQHPQTPIYTHSSKTVRFKNNLFEK